MVDRISALAGHNQPRRLGDPAETGVILHDSQNLVLHQVAAWADSIDEVGKTLAKLIGANAVAGPASAVTGSKGSMLRIEPMKWWLCLSRPRVKPAAMAERIAAVNGRRSG